MCEKTTLIELSTVEAELNVTKEAHNCSRSQDGCKNSNNDTVRRTIVDKSAYYGDESMQMGTHVVDGSTKRSSNLKVVCRVDCGNGILGQAGEVSIQNNR